MPGRCCVAGGTGHSIGVARIHQVRIVLLDVRRAAVHHGDTADPKATSAVSSRGTGISGALGRREAGADITIRGVAGVITELDDLKNTQKFFVSVLSLVFNDRGCSGPRHKKDGKEEALHLNNQHIYADLNLECSNY